MSGHTCTLCLGKRFDIQELQAALLNCLRIAERHPGSVMEKGNRSRAADLKARLTEARTVLAEHLADISVAP